MRETELLSISTWRARSETPTAPGSRPRVSRSRIALLTDLISTLAPVRPNECRQYETPMRFGQQCCVLCAAKVRASGQRPIRRSPDTHAAADLIASAEPFTPSARDEASSAG